jgi:hypothetical protein
VPCGSPFAQKMDHSVADPKYTRRKHAAAYARCRSPTAPGPVRLENDNERMQQRACGEYILGQLQNGPFFGQTDCHMAHGIALSHMCIVGCAEKATK